MELLGVNFNEIFDLVYCFDQGIKPRSQFKMYQILFGRAFTILKFEE